MVSLVLSLQRKRNG